MHTKLVTCLALGLVAAGAARADTSSPERDKPTACGVVLVNDDGVDSRNLAQLAKILAPDVTLLVSAPAKNQSGMSSALGNWREGMAVTQKWQKDDDAAFAIDASPVVAARFGLWQFERLHDRKPDLVVSGPNAGLNLGNAARYSGTVGGAREGAGAGLPGLAISVARGDQPGMSAAALKLSRDMVLRLCDNPAPVLLNLNLPANPKGGLADVVLARPDMQAVAAGFTLSEDGSQVNMKLSYSGTAVPERDLALVRAGKSVLSVLPLEDEAPQTNALEDLLTGDQP